MVKGVLRAFLDLSVVLGASTASGLIQNDDNASLAIAATDATKAEGHSGTTAFTFTVTRTGATNGLPERRPLRTRDQRVHGPSRDRPDGRNLRGAEEDFSGRAISGGRVRLCPAFGGFLAVGKGPNPGTLVGSRAGQEISDAY